MSGPVLRVKGFSTGYKPKNPILTEVSLPDLKAGRLIALIGGNGTGKSTFIRALAGQLSYQGDALLNDKQLSSFTRKERIDLLGYVPQDPPQPSALLAYEFVLSSLRAAAPSLSKQEIERRSLSVFHDFGIEKHLLDPVSTLSGGRRQLLGLIPLFVRLPSLCLLDEPTSSLDMRHELLVLTHLQKAAQTHNALFIIVLHDINLALRFCEQAIVLKDGGLAAAGDVQTTLTAALINDIYGVDARIETSTEGDPFMIAKTREFNTRG